MKPLNDQARKSSLLGRLVVVYLLLVVWCGFLVLRLFDLQVLRFEEFRTAATRQQQGFAVHNTKRGEILDGTLDELAIDVQVYSVEADPELIEDPQSAARQLAPLLDQPPDRLFQDLTSKTRHVYLAKKVIPARAEPIQDLNLKGVFLRRRTHRFYPNKQLAAHLLGFVGDENQGLSGLEYLFDGDIRGEREKIQFQVDARRNTYQRQGESGEDGRTMVLNIDKSIQYIAEDSLTRAVEENRARHGIAIVMRPDNGQILAMASYPTFDPNHYQQFDEENSRNRAILQIFEPGSTFKVVTLAAVLNEGLVSADEIIDCRVGTVQLGGKVYKEAVRSFGELTFEEILAKSSNVGTIKLVLRMGPEKLYDYLKRFGFGDKTGVDLPGEQSGLLRPPTQWSKVSMGALSIGQELGVTPLQMIRALSVIANGGLLVRPYLVRQILTPAGDLVESFEPERKRVLDGATAGVMKQALRAVVEEGTGSLARLNGYSAGGKTGTAQKFVDGHYSSTRYVASFAGFAPLENPELAVIVVIDEPGTHIYGGQVAGPAFKEIMERSLLHLRVPRDRPLNHFAQQQENSEQLASPGVSIDEEHLPAEQLEETVLTLLQQEPSEAVAASLLGRESGLAAVPDFSGKTLRQVARECARAGLVLKISGTGLAVAQRPRAGSQVRPGAVCEVFFSNKEQQTSASRRTTQKSAADLDSRGGR